MLLTIHHHNNLHEKDIIITKLETNIYIYILNNNNKLINLLIKYIHKKSYLIK
jgi:hypothetical protein